MGKAHIAVNNNIDRRVFRPLVYTIMKDGYRRILPAAYVREFTIGPYRR